MTLEALIAYSIASTVVIGFLRVAVWILWPRKTRDPYAEPHGWEER